MKKTTQLLILLIILTLSLPLGRGSKYLFEAYASAQKDAKAERYEEAKRHFPTVDYNEPSLPATKKIAKTEKQKRFNDLGNWVFATTQPYIVENLATSPFNFPALPVAKSDIVLIGVVSETRAYLSENKRETYSQK